MLIGETTVRAEGDVALAAGMTSIASDVAGSYLLRNVEFGNPYTAEGFASSPLLSGYEAPVVAIARGPRPGFVYRGVHAQHPALADALRGEVVPGDINGTITPEQHNLGGYSAESPYTSWTHNFNVARDFALSRGPGGVILELPMGAPPAGAPWRWVMSPDLFGESEVLLRGTRSGANVIKP
jgi:hypothetical protein